MFGVFNLSQAKIKALRHGLYILRKLAYFFFIINFVICNRVILLLP